MRGDDWEDGPEVARADKSQMLLFPASPQVVCDEIGLNWWAALKLHEDGWLSFDPEATPQLDNAQEAELRFVGALINGGCDPAMLGRLLKDLSSPYSYRMNEIYFDWSACRWRLLPERIIQPEAIVTEWIEELKETTDLETLESLAEYISAAIDSVKLSVSNG